MQKSIHIKFMIIIFVIVMGLTSCNWITNTQEQPTARNETNTAIQNTPEFTPTEEKPGEKKVDFQALWDENMDIIAWIEIPGTIIDYPVAQTYDNQYYLDNSIRKDPDEYGAIFLDCESSRDFLDRNVVVYGHNNDDGTMFADLHRFEDEEFLENNRMVYVYTPAKKLVYKIYASYERDSKRVLWQADFDDDEFYSSYLESIAQYDGRNDNILDDVSVRVDDRIITLSTCVKNRKTRRYIVVGVLVEETAITE